MELLSSLNRGLRKMNITKPTDIQEQCFLPALEGKNIIACSATGTGKTLAYLLPIIQKNHPEGAISKECYAAVVVPSKELSIQICKEINRLSNESGVPVTAAALFGGVNKNRQLEVLKSKPNIVVGTYQRLYELIKDKKIAAHQVKTLVIDEADSLMKKDHLEGLLILRKCFMRDTQIMMFSASMKEQNSSVYQEFSIYEFVKIFTNSKMTIPTNIHHLYFVTEKRDRIETTRKVIKASKSHRCLIFTASKYDSDEITQKLVFHHYKAACLNSDLSSNERRAIMDDFRSGRLEYIICSDLAARGLHMDQVDTVINIGLPDQPVDYLHRCGRCGRDGADANCINIILENELTKVKSIQKTFNINFCAKKLYQGQIVRK